jgi:chromate transporter
MRNPIEPGPSASGELKLPAASTGGGGSSFPEARKISTLRLCRIFLEVGATSFGGLGPSLAIIERELVERRGVLTAADVAEATAATRFLPGSTLIQVMSFLGYRLKGWTGSAAATVACVLPPVAAMLLLAMFYDALSHWSAFGRAAQGLTQAVVGLLMASACRFGRATVGGPIAFGIALTAFGSAAGLDIPAAAVIVAAGLIGVLLLSTSGAEPARGSGKGGRP